VTTIIRAIIALVMEAARRNVGNFYQSTRCNISEDSNIMDVGINGCTEAEN
jgi:hypothetical protein